MTLSEYLALSRETQAEFAERVGVTQSMVWQWITRRRPVAPKRCPIIERETGGAVRCEDLRPDVDWATVRAGVAAAVQTQRASATEDAAS